MQQIQTRVVRTTLLRVWKVVWQIQSIGVVLLALLSFFPRLFHLEEYLFFALLGLAVLTLWLQRAWSWPRTPVDLPLVLFIGWVLLTIPFSIEPEYSFAEWRKIVAQVLVFYWAIIILRESPNGFLREKILGAVVIGTSILCVYAIDEFLKRGGTLMDRHIRAAAPYSDYNWLSTYLVITIPLIITASVLARYRWQRIMCGIVCGLALITQFVSYTRAGWLAHAVQAIFWALASGRRRAVIWIVSGLLLVVTALFIVSYAGYHRDTMDPWTLNARIAVWKLGLDEVIKHPILGVGYGSDTFMQLFSSYVETEKAPGVHSTFLMVAMGSGLPACFLLLWIFLKLIAATLPKRSPDKRDHVISIAVGLVAIGFLVRNLFDYMFAGSLAYLFWIVAAVGLAKLVDPASHSIHHESD